VGGVNVPVETVCQQRGQVVLLRLPFIGAISIGGEDDKRLTAEVGQRRLLHRRRPRELVDEAAEVAGGRGIGARLVPRPGFTGSTRTRSARSRAWGGDVLLTSIVGILAGPDK
jgi:hypothetical protein